MISSTDAEKICYKNFQHTRDKKNFLNIINYINDKLSLTSFNGEIQ